MLTIKRGDTFAFYINLKDDQQSPLEIEDYNIRSQIRNGRDELLEELRIVSDVVPGRYRIFADSTEDWPVTSKDPKTILSMDIEITVDDYIRSSETIRIRVTADVTRDE